MYNGSTTAVQRKNDTDDNNKATLKSRTGSTSSQSDKRPHVTFNNIEEFRDQSTIDPPENFLDGFVMRPRSLSHHLSAEKVPSRKWLRMQARFWRSLMNFAMHFHDLARPRPPKPTFRRSMSTDTIPVDLYFYLPPSYYETLRQNPEHRFPCVVNFHGGGFSLGSATDDRYWARVVLKETEAVFVSVDYRRAPEHPFPTAVDDSADALIYLCEHAQDLHIDTTNIALSGFSAGANLVFSVPLRLAYHRKIKATASKRPAMPPSALSRDDANFLTVRPPPFAPPPSLSRQTTNQSTFATPFDTPSPTASHVTTRNEEECSPSTNTSAEHLPPTTPLTVGDAVDFASNAPPPHNPRAVDFAPSHHNRSTASLMLLRTVTGAPLRITTIVAWYPLLDWTQSRSSKKRSSLNPPKCLPKTFTDLFDHAYLPPPDPAGDHASPYASPGLAPSHMLTEALPPDMQLWLCEWDMLLKEGQEFSQRLQQLGKNVDSILIPRVPHGWDKSPNPFRDQGAIDILYEKAARGMAQVFEHDSEGRLRSRTSSIHEDVARRQPRHSVVPYFG